MQNHERPSSAAAPLRESDLGIIPPDDDDGPSLPVVRILGMKLTSIVLVLVLVGGAFFGLRFVMSYSSAEVGRASSEIHDGLSPR